MQVKSRFELFLCRCKILNRRKMDSDRGGGLNDLRMQLIEGSRKPGGSTAQAWKLLFTNRNGLCDPPKKWGMFSMTSMHFKLFLFCFLISCGSKEILQKGDISRSPVSNPPTRSRICMSECLSQGRADFNSAFQDKKISGDFLYMKCSEICNRQTVNDRIYNVLKTEHPYTDWSHRKYKPESPSCGRVKYERCLH